MSIFIVKNNWLGKLELNFTVKQGRSLLSRHTHRGPFFVQKSFYPKEDDKLIPHVYLLNPSGGLVGGDKLVLSVLLEPGSKALLTTPSSSKFYRTNGLYAIQEFTFKLKKNSFLEWIPQSNIFFPNTKARISTVFDLDQGACVIFFEIYFFRNLYLKGCNKPEEIDVLLDIILPDVIGFKDRFRINSLNCITKLNGFQIVANFFAVPADEIMLKQIRKLIKSITDHQIGGVTLLDELLVVRLLGNDNQQLNSLLYEIWNIARFSIIGRKAIIPRI